MLVEDHGRVNYGPRIGEPKGLIGGATLDGRPLTRVGRPAARPRHAAAGVDRPGRRPRPSPDRCRVRSCCAPGSTSTEPADLHLDTGGWGRGVVWVNGFCLGRYWSRGPQRTLYVPGPVLRADGNELVVLELAALTEPTVRFVPRPLLGHTEA